MIFLAGQCAEAVCSRDASQGAAGFVMAAALCGLAKIDTPFFDFSIVLKSLAVKERPTDELLSFMFFISSVRMIIAELE